MWNAIVVGWVGLLLLAPALAALVGWRVVPFENRRLAALPEWRTASWLELGAYAALGTWFQDHLPLRSEAVALDAWIDLMLLGDSPSQEVLIGRDGELFLADSLAWSCEPTAEPERVLEVLARIRGALESTGAGLYVVVSPSKLFLHAERLPARSVPANDCVAERRDRLRAGLARAEGLVFVDVWSAFEAERARGTSLFPLRGRHWNTRAAVIQTRELLRALDRSLWDERFVVDRGETTSDSELPLRFMNLHVPQTLPLLAIQRDDVDVSIEVERLSQDSTYEVGYTRATSATARLLPGHTVVVFDSFIRPSVDWLARFLERGTFVHWDEFGYRPQVAARLLRGADRVVLQLVEDRRGFALTERTGGVMERALRAPGRGR